MTLLDIGGHCFEVGRYCLKVPQTWFPNLWGKAEKDGMEQPVEHLNEPTEPVKQMDQEVQDESQKGPSPAAAAALVSPPVPDEDPPLPPPADPPPQDVKRDAMSSKTRGKADGGLPKKQTWWSRVKGTSNIYFCMAQR